MVPTNFSSGVALIIQRALLFSQEFLFCLPASLSYRGFGFASSCSRREFYTYKRNKVIFFKSFMWYSNDMFHNIKAEFAKLVSIKVLSGYCLKCSDEATYVWSGIANCQGCQIAFLRFPKTMATLIFFSSVNAGLLSNSRDTFTSGAECFSTLVSSSPSCSGSWAGGCYPAQITCQIYHHRRLLPKKENLELVPKTQTCRAAQCTKTTTVTNPFNKAYFSFILWRWWLAMEAVGVGEEELAIFF